MNEDIGRQVGETIGKVTDFDVQKDSTGWGKVLRLLIQLDLNKPISQDKTLNLMGDKVWVPLTYKKLLKLYFQYGYIVQGQRYITIEQSTPNFAKGQFEPG